LSKMSKVQHIFDCVSKEHICVPKLILEFVGLSDKAACARVCLGWKLLMSKPQFWTSLDFRGLKNPVVTLARALRVPVVAENLRSLNLEFCKEVTDAHLAGVGGLEYLNLNALHKLTDDGVVTVAKACGPRLLALELYWHHARGSPCLVEVAKACPNLTLLNLSGCQAVEDSACRAIARHCPALANLDLTRCPLLSDASLTFLCPRLKGSLKSLNLYANSQFTDEGYLAIAQLGHLEFLDLCGAGKISSEAIAAIARGCGRSLVSLNLTWCVHCDDAALHHVASHCPKLELLSVFGLVKITDACVVELATARADPGCAHTLTTLDVHGCCNISRQAESELLKLFPRLTCFTHHS